MAFLYKFALHVNTVILWNFNTGKKKKKKKSVWRLPFRVLWDFSLSNTVNGLKGILNNLVKCNAFFIALSYFITISNFHGDCLGYIRTCFSISAAEDCHLLPIMHVSLLRYNWKINMELLRVPQESCNKEAQLSRKSSRSVYLVQLK